MSSRITRLAAGPHCCTSQWPRVSALAPIPLRLGVRSGEPQEYRKGVTNSTCWPTYSRQARRPSHRYSTQAGQKMVVAKRFVQDPVVLVDSALLACVAVQPGLAINKASRVVYRPPIPAEPKVTLLSGGGSGHEPGHAGYVAEGMLDAAVSGPIFASPNAKHIRVGLGHIESPKGTLVIVKNYTGDRLNFGLATEQARAYDGREIELVVVEDDVAVPRSRCRLVGRRGLAGVALVHKVAGASAAENSSLSEVTAKARDVSENIATIGVSLDACSVPGVQQGRHVAPDEIELGMGIHNEPGTQRIKADQGTSKIINIMLSAILDRSDPERGFLEWTKGTQFVLMVNNLGGLSKLELLSLTEHVLSGLKADFDITPCRVYSGTYLSSLDGHGFSVTLLAMSNEKKATETLRLLDAPTKCVNWSPALPLPDTTNMGRVDSTVQPARAGLASQNRDPISYDESFLRSIVDNVYASLNRAEPEITRFDTHLGDGDCGTTLLAGAAALKQIFATNGKTNPSDLVTDIQRLTDNLGTAMGGTSGALYSIFFSGFINGMQHQLKENPSQNLSLPLFSAALVQGLATMRKYTGAGIGDRTMMDALIPFVEKLHERRENDLSTAFEEAVEAARSGRDKTARQQSRYGRSTYVGAAYSQGQSDAALMPDPGACGVVAIVDGVLSAIKYGS